MDGLIDGELLEGPHDVRITYRPAREAWPIRPNQDFVETVELLCQIWGGAVSPIIPVDKNGSIRQVYRQHLPGSVDQVVGAHPFDLFNPGGPTVALKDPERPLDLHGSQFSPALLKYREQDNYRPLESPVLAKGDPWRDIYAACLGRIPAEPDDELIRANYLREDLRFDDFLLVARPLIQGSLNDLLTRLDSDDALNSRRLSMVGIPYGSISRPMTGGQRELRSNSRAAIDAGPQVIVISQNQNVEDAALLWNLRTKWDVTATPIGIPFGSDTADLLRELLSDQRVLRGWSSYRNIAYVTSASLTVEQLTQNLGSADSILGDRPQGWPVLRYAEPGEILTLGGPVGWRRNEVFSWKNGESLLAPLSGDELRAHFGDGLGRFTRIYVDVRVNDVPLPDGEDVRFDAGNYEILNGAMSRWGSGDARADPIGLRWPTTLQSAAAAASWRDVQVRESEPGRASLTLLKSLGGIEWLSFIAHAPLLILMENMAARQGFNWYKSRQRRAASSVRDEHPLEHVGNSIDELPEVTFAHFKKALRTEKATRHWLGWAERANLIVKGFSIECSDCHATQWIPIAAFSPPILCRGCTSIIEFPFGHRTNIDFRYRLSERLRRVYSQDAMGHLLTLRYFHFVLGGSNSRRIIGQHPGIEVVAADGRSVLGEADVLILDRAGELVPVEVKRTHGGMTESELGKLDSLVQSLKAPWSAVVACEYGKDTSSDFANLERHDVSGRYTRLVLTYDKLLEPHPHWALGSDPFRWEPMNEDKIADREERFISRLTLASDEPEFDWLSDTMTKRPSPPA